MALFGGSALYSDPLIVGRPNIPDIEAVVADVRSILSSESLTNNGPLVRRFEDRIREISGTEHCIATCNATAALELTCRALALEGEVIIPSFTFIATAHALAWQGLTPVFVDVDPETHTIDPAKVEAAITSSTSAICGVHLWGNVCDVGALQSIADSHNLTLWFDAAHAFSVEHDGKKVGNFGVAEVFSFHATKFVNAFEGGAIVTNDAELARTLREMRNFGFDQDRLVTHLGINAKMPEVSAAMGLRSLEFLDQIRSTNRRNHHYYTTLLESCKGIVTKVPGDVEGSNYQYIVLEIDEEETGISRDLLLKVLGAEGIHAQRYFYPGCHLAMPYRDKHLQRKTLLPVTERLAHTVLVLPTGLTVGVDDIMQVCDLIKFVVVSSNEVQRELEHRDLRI